MNTTRTTLASILAAASLLTLGACSSDDKNASAPTPSTSSAQPTKNVTPGVESPNTSQSANTLPDGPIKLSDINPYNTGIACERLLGKPSDVLKAVGKSQYALNSVGPDKWSSVVEGNSISEKAPITEIPRGSSQNSNDGVVCTTKISDDKNSVRNSDVSVIATKNQIPTPQVNRYKVIASTKSNNVNVDLIEFDAAGLVDLTKPAYAMDKAAAAKLVDQVAKQIAA